MLLAAGCSEAPKYKIGVSQCSQDDWRRKMNEEIEREIMLHPDAEVEIRSADDSNEKQIRDIRYFMDHGFDIIIAAPNEADAITPVISEAYDKGIPVIVFDRNVNGNKYTAYQGVDNQRLGESAAKYAYTLVGDDARILEIYGLKGSTPATDRHTGFARRAAASGMNIVATGYGNWNYDDGAKVADSLLSLHPDVDLIYAHNDRMAIAASKVARKRGLNPRVIGIDAAPEIGIKAVADSLIDATFLYPTEGHALIRTALNIIEGRPYDKVKMFPVASAVDKSNADILLLQNRSLEEETDKIRMLKTQVDDYWSKHSAQTTLFYAAIFILILLFISLFLTLRAYWQRKRHQQQLMEQNALLQEQRDLQKSLNDQLQAATQSKLAFFTNVSHDLRTPLTLISEPVAQLLKSENISSRERTLMKLADKNVRILRRLINQILDFRKYENGSMQANLTETDLPALMREWAASFNEMARKRDIRLNVDIESPEDPYLAVDPEKMERIFFNIMGNAFKFTRDNGRISVCYRAEGDKVRFSITDNGLGISEEDQKNIFDRFFEVDRIHPNGSGLGLTLAKAFVELHGGTIEVESLPGKGSEFIVEIPVRHVHREAAQPDPVQSITTEDIVSELSAVGSDDTAGDSSIPADADEYSDKPLLLVIDDNCDILNMMTGLMDDEYRVITASNGREGLRLAVKYVPDLVVCDVMMPVMDGLECCRLIKEEVSTSHIPVLMLTACSLDEQRLSGYENGADGYVAKPFSIDLLRARCRSLVANRRRIRELFSAGKGTEVAVNAPSGNAATASTPDVEDEFYARFIKIVEEEMGNPDLSVDDLASRIGLGRSQFYRKIKALTNYSPVELLRRFRLQKARSMLTKTSRSISEVAYAVGFSSPAYFTRCYREAYGETPRELRERLTKK